MRLLPGEGKQYRLVTQAFRRVEESSPAVRPAEEDGTELESQFPELVQRRASPQGISGWDEVVEEEATMPLCLFPGLPGLKGKGRLGIPGRQDTKLLPTPHHPPLLC